LARSKVDDLRLRLQIGEQQPNAFEVDGGGQVLKKMRLAADDQLPRSPIAPAQVASPVATSRAAVRRAPSVRPDASFRCLRASAMVRPQTRAFR
jgi:hypothetical protein